MAKTVKKTTKTTTKKVENEEVKPIAKATAKKTTTSKPSAKKTTAKKTTVKKTTKPAVKKVEDKQSRMAQHRKKIQEIKNNYEGPVKNDTEEENYDEYRLPIIGRTRFSDVELAEFKALIQGKIDEARGELNFYQEQMKESEMNDDDIKFSGMEDGGHTNDKEHLSSMANRQIKFIQNLESAIIRIENKTYGICRMTGNLIDKKRLMAVPHATLSMEAKLGEKKK